MLRQQRARDRHFEAAPAGALLSDPVALTAPIPPAGPFPLPPRPSQPPRDIAAGEELTISYCDETDGLEGRQAELQNWGFECGCPRCAADRAKGAGAQACRSEGGS